MIENIKYKILNKSEKETEVLPQVGQTYELLVRCFPEDSDIKVTMHYKEMIDEFFEPRQRKLV